MSSFLNFNAARQELTVFLRNSDIFTITERGVTTATATGTFAGETSLLIDVANGKNIRSITVAASPLALGTDYTVDLTFDDSGTTKIKISFVSAQTGDYSIPYDFGTDKIWPDFPRDDLSINSYPRVAVDIQDVGSDAFGIGGSDYISDIAISVVVYAQSTEKIDSLISTIREKIMTANSDFFYLRFIKPTGTGPLIQDPDKRQEIMSRNVDFTSAFNVEQT